MTRTRSALVAGLAAIAALAVGAPAAGASTAPIAFSLPSGLSLAHATPPVRTLSAIDGFGGLGTPGGCNTGSGPQGQGGTGEPRVQACVGAGLVFIGPATGQIATVIGPTIIGGQVFVGNSVVSAGSTAVGG